MLCDNLDDAIVNIKGRNAMQNSRGPIADIIFAFAPFASSIARNSSRVGTAPY